MPNEINFTKRTIENLPAPKKGRDRYIDAQVRGLGVLVQPSGHKSFYWFRKVRNYPRRETLGRFGDLSVEQARDAATGLNNRLAVWKAGRYEGENPFASRREESTLDEIVELYVQKQLRPFAKKPERAEKDFRSVVARRMAPWRSRTLASIEQQEVEDAHTRIGEKEKHKRAANVFVKTLRVLFSFAEKKKLFRGANPAKGFTLYTENKRARFLQQDELPKLFTALRRAPNPDLRDFVNLSLWTGARKMDVLSMRWQDLALDGGNSWTIPDPKNRIPYMVPLTMESVEILKMRLRHRVVGNRIVGGDGAQAQGKVH